MLWGLKQRLNHSISQLEGLWVRISLVDGHCRSRKENTDSKPRVILNTTAVTSLGLRNYCANFATLPFSCK